jgi:hypothetical protein
MGLDILGAFLIVGSIETCLSAFSPVSYKLYKS